MLQTPFWPLSVIDSLLRSSPTLNLTTHLVAANLLVHEVDSIAGEKRRRCIHQSVFSQVLDPHSRRWTCNTHRSTRPPGAFSGAAPSLSEYHVVIRAVHFLWFDLDGAIGHFHEQGRSVWNELVGNAKRAHMKYGQMHHIASPHRTPYF